MDEQQANKTAVSSQENLQITPQNLAELLKSETPPRLLDVRGEEERNIVTLKGDLHVTSELIEEMQASWPKDTPIVTYCHAGMRSLDAANYLISQGFTNVKSLQGGIDAWASDVDPSLPRY